MSQEPTKKVLTVEERLAEFQNWLSLEDPGFIRIRDRVSKMMRDFAAQESSPLVEAVKLIAGSSDHSEFKDEFECVECGDEYPCKYAKAYLALTAHRLKYPEVKP